MEYENVVKEKYYNAFDLAKIIQQHEEWYVKLCLVNDLCADCGMCLESIDNFNKGWTYTSYQSENSQLNSKKTTVLRCRECTIAYKEYNQYYG